MSAASSPTQTPKWFQHARGAWLLGALWALLALGFAWYTQHAWEDYLITFRASQNLALTGEFVFQHSERIQTYTSPLGTLIPALFALGGGSGVEERALWGLRFVSVLALALSMALAARELSASRLGTFATFAGLALWFFDAKTVDFSINGMETAFVILFMVLLWRALNRGLPLGQGALAITGLQWTRPDGFMVAGALLFAWLVLGFCERRQSLGASLGKAARACALAILLYLPWLVFVWVYYGTPIPHTIIAKQGTFIQEGGPLQALLLYPWSLLTGHAAVQEIYLPAYWFFGGWPGFLHAYSILIATGAILVCLIPSVPRAGRILSLALLVGGLYVEVIPRSPWYFPVWQCLGFLSWAYLLSWALTRPSSSGGWRAFAIRAVTSLSLVCLVCQVATFACVAYQMRSQQRIIETEHRKQLALWLRQAAAPGDRVYLEPLGYIGYYSELKMLDNPGLASREVVAARHSGRTSHARIIAELSPEWLVLRPDQFHGIRDEAPGLLDTHYSVACVFNTRAEIDALTLLPGRGYLNFDAVFIVMKRTAPGGPVPVTASARSD